jgi:hypothetical protein
LPTPSFAFGAVPSLSTATTGDGSRDKASTATAPTFSFSATPNLPAPAPAPAPATGGSKDKDPSTAATNSAAFGAPTFAAFSMPGKTSESQPAPALSAGLVSACFPRVGAPDATSDLSP